ncbi:hypothetical protein BKI52_29490 [marine bacterium AO1-C]|nr:hypothetical protein BKI52_29490 [marine bacterium AO1-C]
MMFNLNLVRLLLFFLIQYLLLGCNLFEKEFVLPLPVAQEANQVGVVGFTAHWKKVTGASSYEIDIALDKEFTQFVPNYQDKKVDSLSLLVIGLEANTPYYYRVRANISSQTSQNSNVISVTTEALDTPVIYPATEVSATGFRVHWKKMPVVTTYLLEVAFDEKFRKPVTNYDSIAIAPTDTSLMISNVEVDKQYFYRVKVKQSNSSSEYSNTQSVFTSTLPRPEVLPATSIQLTSFVAHWKTLPEALSYRIDVASDALFQQMLAGYDDRVVNTNNVVVPNLNAHTDYFYRVRAVNANATSNHSEVMTVTTLNLSAPIATKASDIQSGGFQANWTQVPQAASYLLDVALDENFTQILPNYNSKAIIGNSVIVQSVDASTNYYYRVRARGLNATSDYSNTILVVTGLLPAPIAEAASSQKVFGFTTNWQAQPDISLYLLDVATDASFINFVSGYQAKEVTGSSITVNGLDFRQTYYYRLRSKRLNKVSDYSNVIQVSPCISNGCKVSRLEVFTSGSSRGAQTFTYDTQHRLTEIEYVDLYGIVRRYLVDYNANGTIQKVTYFYQGSASRIYQYTYTNGLVTSIQENYSSGSLRTFWTFTHNAQGQRTSWSVYNDLAQTNLQIRYDYTLDTRGNVTEVHDNGGSLRYKYDYDEQLSPYAIIDPNLSFFILTNRDRSGWHSLLWRGFLPVNNIKREQITGSTTEVFIFNYDPKGIAIAQDAFYSVAFQFIGCNF